MNSVDLHIHNSMGCYVDQMGAPVCPFGAHQTTQNLILTCARDLWPDYKIHNPLILCFAKYMKLTLSSWVLGISMNMKSTLMNVLMPAMWILRPLWTVSTMEEASRYES